MQRSKALKKAEQLITGDRAKDYGDAYLGSLQCFIDNFNGSTTGTTTFNTIDNLFLDYENGTIENGLNNFGEDYAEIIKNTNRTIYRR